jgi:hypothetical protein
VRDEHLEQNVDVALGDPKISSDNRCPRHDERGRSARGSRS